MATSGTVDTTKFNALKVIDTAFRRCKVLPQTITSDMLTYAKDSLHLLLGSLGNPRPPSWCIEKVLLAMDEANPVVELPVGTISVLNLNYREVQIVEGTVTEPAGYYVIEFAEATTVSTVGVNWNPSGPDPLTMQVSDDGLTWTTVGTIENDVANNANILQWTDVAGALPHLFFRLVVSVSVVALNSVVTGNTPSEIPMGPLNRDQYAQQNNQNFPGRPTVYWFQRTFPVMRVNLWPAPNAAAVAAQLVLWRHRHIMDVGALKNDLEIPTRWLEAITYALAVQLAEQTPEVKMDVTAYLTSRAGATMREAWEGDGDGSSTFIQPNIAPYTR